MTDYIEIFIKKGIPLFLITFIMFMLFDGRLHTALITGILVGCALSIMQIIEDKRKKP